MRPTVAFLLVGAFACMATAAEKDCLAEAKDNDLVVRLLAPEGGQATAARVGAPFRFRVELVNQADEARWVVGRAYAQVHLVYRSEGVLFVRGKGTSPPLASSLVKLQPGGSHGFDVSVTPTLAGAGEVFVTMANGSRLVLERSETQDRAERVELPGLWRGAVTVSFKLEAASARGLGDPRRDADLARLQRGDLAPAAAVAKWNDWAVAVPDERFVNALRARLAQPDVGGLERMACLTHLVVAAHRGFGYRALPHLVAMAGDAERPVRERLIALEAVGIAQVGQVAVYAPVTYRLNLATELQAGARKTLKALAAGGDAELAGVARRMIDAE